jgi:hypothetical protein
MTFCLYVLGAVLLTIGVGCLLLGLPTAKQVGPLAETPPDADPVYGDASMMLPLKRRIDPIVCTLPLTSSQRTVILNRYDEAYTQSGVWADIKLQCFIDLILSIPPSQPVPVFYAQKRILLAFAADHRMPWLQDAIERGSRLAPTKRALDNSASPSSLRPIPEDVA